VRSESGLVLNGELLVFYVHILLLTSIVFITLCLVSQVGHALLLFVLLRLYVRLLHGHLHLAASLINYDVALVCAPVDPVVEVLRGLGSIIFNRQQILLTFLPLQLACVGCVGLSAPLFLLLFALLLHLVGLCLGTHLHVSIHRVLFLCTKQTGVVFGEVALLALTHLATHYEAWTKLDGLRVHEARAGSAVLLLACHLD